ncbi:MAG TPA: PEP/pyruvate-binding domain-containing protein [Polyangiaceae bacterium]|nr:PEP/pyruvate-binding domain-containing protein [Polyangiaceae bacterium]
MIQKIRIDSAAISEGRERRRPPSRFRPFLASFAVPMAVSLGGLFGSLGCSSENKPAGTTPMPSATGTSPMPSATGTSMPPTTMPPATELTWPCEATEGANTLFVRKTGCKADFDILASQPLDASIPGARSGKVVLDLMDQNQLYFQNSNKYPIHYEFAKANLSKPPNLTIGSLSDFNPQYTLPLAERRFMLGAVTYYEAPKIWALEIAPYDTSTPDMIKTLFDAVKANAYYGPVLKFHPTSEAVDASARKATGVPLVTTDELYASIDYQPLNLGEVVGPLKMVRSVDLDNIYVSARDIVVLDAIPNDISPTAGIITEQFQTPLSHINVLARTRHTPNMGLRKATTNPLLTPLFGKHVRLTVGSFEWKVVEVTQEESNAWWEQHKPAPVTLPDPDISVTDLRDVETVTEHTDVAPYVTLDALKASIRIFGAKAANYSVFATDPKVPHKKGFAIPVYFYDAFMKANGFYDRVTQLEQDPNFTGQDSVRDQKLAELRADLMKADIGTELKTKLKEKLDKDYPGKAIRFRSSTNAEDLDGFPCAGCYDSHTGDPAEFGGDQIAAAAEAIKKTWATVWNLRTYEERKLHSIAHTKVAMALLVHTNFPDEEANGVAVTANIFDPTGNAPGFYVNVQKGGQAEVVHPPPGVTSDSFLYQYSFPNQPVIYYTRSNLVNEGEHVLDARQIYDLGQALNSIHERFRKAYQASPDAWYAMDCEFKFDDEAAPGQKPSLYIKQARPYADNPTVSSN